MGTLINSKAYSKQLDKNIEEIFFDEWMALPLLFSQIARVDPAPSGGNFTEAELSTIGNMRELTEGEGVQFDAPEEGNEVSRTYTKFGLGVQLTEEMLSDDVHGHMRLENFIPKLAKAANTKVDTKFFNLFNNGFSTELAWDGSSIFNDSHSTLKTGATVDNNSTSALSETSLQAAKEYFDKAVDSAGNYIMLKPKFLIVPPELQWTAGKLLRNIGAIGTADNDLNTMNPSNGMMESWNIIASPYLTSTTAWFVLSSDHDFSLKWKWEPKMETSDDFATGNMLAKMTMRFLPYCNNYTGAYGSSGA